MRKLYFVLPAAVNESGRCQTVSHGRSITSWEYCIVIITKSRKGGGSVTRKLTARVSTSFKLGVSNSLRVYVDTTTVERRVPRGLTPKEIASDCRRLSQGHNVFDLLGSHPETNPKASTPRKKSGSAEPTWVKEQEKTFTRWINQHLRGTDYSVQNFDKDLQDGVCLIELLQQLSGTKLTRKW